MRAVYLDHNATTPMSDGALRRLVDVAREAWGNPGAAYPLGLAARRELDRARESVAALAGARPSEVVFTSGGTEANVAALWNMVASARRRDGGAAERLPHIVTAATEHPSVLRPLEAWSGLGLCRVTVLPVDPRGHVDLEALDRGLPEADGLALMLANHETGTLLRMAPVAARVRAARERGAAVPWHADAIQLAGKLPLDLSTGPAEAISTLSLAAHKLGGPPGAGALVVRDAVGGAAFEPLLVGGAQESGRRAGTPPVALLAAFGVAAVEAGELLSEGEPQRQVALRARLLERLRGLLPGLEVHGDLERSVPNTLSVSLPHPDGDGTLLDGEEMMLELASRGVSVSTGAACATGSGRPSHVLLAMGVPPARASSTLRFSLGRGTTEDDVDRAIEAFEAALGEF